MSPSTAKTCQKFEIGNGATQNESAKVVYPGHIGETAMKFSNTFIWNSSDLM
jgi:hypothetical protein